MAPSFLKSVGAAALAFAANAGATQSYQVSEVYNSTNFFDKFNFFTSTDPNGGYVQFQSQSAAQDLGLVKYQNGAAYVGVDTSSGYSASGAGRKSVRLESKNVYNHGLVIADFSHLPKPVCGSWPAFWFFGTPWPTKGEVDLYENWNDLTFNRHTAHVDSPDVVGECTLAAADMSATIDSSNCYDFAQGQSNYQGCSASEYSTNFGSSSGGIYAMEWTSDYIKIWDWSRTGAPSDILNGKPVPSSSWGTPTYAIKQCNIDKAFKDMNMVLNIDFCGVAGQSDKWDSSCKASTGSSTCAEYVAKGNSDFSDVYFQVEDIKIYQLKDDQTSTSSAVSSTSKVASTSSSSATTSSSVSAATSSSVPSSKSSSTISSVTSTTVSSAVSSTASSTASGDDDSCTDDDGPTSSSSIASPTASSTTSSDDDSCTDEDGPTSSSSVASSTASVSATTTKSGSSSTQTAVPYPSGNSSFPVPSGPSGVSEFTTSTIYTTSVRTITSCAATVTNCPARGYTTTEIISIGTTVCPVTATATGSSAKPTTTAVASEGFTTSTVKVTNTYTITSCKPTVTDCPVGAVTTEVTVTTTVCPIETASPVPSPSSNSGSGSGSSSESVKPIGSTGVASQPSAGSTATGGTVPSYPVATSNAATPSVTVGSGSGSSSGSGSGSNSATEVLATATAPGYPVASSKVNYNATLTTSFTNFTSATSTSSIVASTSSVVVVSAGVKVSATSFALAGVAAFFFFAM